MKNLLAILVVVLAVTVAMGDWWYEEYYVPEFILDITDPNNVKLENRGDVPLGMDVITITAPEGGLNIVTTHTDPVTSQIYYTYADGTPFTVPAPLVAEYFRVYPSPSTLSTELYMSCDGMGILPPGSSYNLGPLTTTDDATGFKLYDLVALDTIYWGRVIPEPASMALLAPGGLALLRRRR